MAKRLGDGRSCPRCSGRLPPGRTSHAAVECIRQLRWHVEQLEGGISELEGRVRALEGRAAELEETAQRGGGSGGYGPGVW